MTTRSFNLLGVIYQDPAVATVTINGTQVYQGSLSGSPKDPDIEEDQELITAGSYTFDDSTTVSLPVTVTLQSGQIDLGMFEWNYAWEVVPGSDPEEWIQNPNLYAYGANVTTSLCNRTDELINGTAVPDPGTNIPIMMHAGDTVTFNTIIFSSPGT